jgi:hypothetical protein
MRDSSRSGSPPVPKRPPVTPGFDWIMTILSAVFISGLFLDGWAHTHGRVDETFFTPWHAVLYGGYLACAVVLLGALAQHAARPAEVAYLLEKCGIVGILLETIISMGAVLLLLRRQPFVGSLTLMLGLNAVAMGFLYGRGPYPLAQVAAFAGGGVVADALRVIIRPTLERPRTRTLFAFATPAVLHIFYFLSLKLTHGLWWSVHLWLGPVVLSGLVGCLLAYLLAPESSDQQQARPTGARHRHAERVTDLPPRIGSGVRGHHG